MNPDIIFTHYRDDALANLVTSKEYCTFVAMPFADRFSYRSKTIYHEVFRAAALKANDIGTGKRPFGTPERVDDDGKPAISITEEIVRRILFSHFFLADLTFENTGVLLEAGIAMGLKSNNQIILVTQGDLKDLHFDIRNVNVLVYNPVECVEQIAKVLLHAADMFERDAERIITKIKESLTPDALAVLNKYGSLQKANKQQSLHRHIADWIFNDGDHTHRFEDATRELLQRRLIYTDYRTKVTLDGDAFGMHATDIGWAVIGQIWPEIAQN